MRYIAKLMNNEGKQIYCCFNDYDTSKLYDVAPHRAAEYLFSKAQLIAVTNKDIKKMHPDILSDDFDVVSVMPLDNTIDKQITDNSLFNGYSCCFDTMQIKNIILTNVHNIKSGFEEFFERVDNQNQFIVLYSTIN